MKLKPSKWEKLDNKYGDAVMRELSKKNDSADFYYKCYVRECSKVHAYEVGFNVTSFMALAFSALAITVHAAFILLALLMVVLATYTSLAITISILWENNWINNLFETCQMVQIEERLSKLEKKGKK